MTDTEPDEPTSDVESDDRPGSDIPDWEDEYVDRVSDRLQFNYDLKKDERVRSESFTLYGQLSLLSQKEFFHPALSYGHHESIEHLFVRRADSVSVADLERLVSLGHDLADEWIEANEEHYSTEFTFVVLAPTIPDDVRAFVVDFRDRTLLKYGYFGHYEINLVVVAPDREKLVSSREADVREAFELWESIEQKEPGLLQLISRRLQI